MAAAAVVAIGGWSIGEEGAGLLLLLFNEPVTMSEAATVSGLQALLTLMLLLFVADGCFSGDIGGVQEGVEDALILTCCCF